MAVFRKTSRLRYSLALLSLLLAYVGGMGLGALLPSKLGGQLLFVAVLSAMLAPLLFLWGTEAGPTLFLEDGSRHGFFVPRQNGFAHGLLVLLGDNAHIEVAPYAGNPRRFVRVRLRKDGRIYELGTVSKDDGGLKDLLAHVPESAIQNR